MAFRTRHAIATAALAILVSGCELMQPVDDPLPGQVAELERRLAALERMLASGSLIDLTVQLDEQQREQAELLGRVQTIENESSTTADRQRDLYNDLDARIQNLERGVLSGSMSAGSGGGAGALPVPGGSDRANYEAAFELLKEQRYDAAATAFQQFLSAFPDSPLANNAQYWLAESYYVTDQFAKALAEFQLVVSAYPRSGKIPDALLKIGYSNYELEQWSAARTALQRVTDDFPDSTAARLAAQRLRRMVEESR